jgi:predicted DNA-binding ribbon-helix-helix protein
MDKGDPEHMGRGCSTPLDRTKRWGAEGSVVGSDDVVSQAYGDAQGSLRYRTLPRFAAPFVPMAPDMFASLPCYNAASAAPMKSQRTKSLVMQRTIVVAGHKTTVRLEDQFFEALKQIAAERGSTLQDLVTSIKGDRSEPNLSSALRVYVLGYYQGQRRTPSE